MQSCRASARALFACTLLLLFSSIARADGELRTGFPYTVDSTSKQPAIQTAAAIGSDGTIYVTVNYGAGSDAAALIALDPVNAGANGFNRKWIHVLGDTTGASPTLGPDGAVYVGADDGLVYAFTKPNGDPKWAPFDVSSVTGNLALVTATAALSPDGATLYISVAVSASDAGTSLGGGLLALSTATGQKLWYWPAPGGPVLDSAAVASDGTIYVAAIGASNRGYLAALLPSGAEKWHRDFVGPVLTSPAIGADGTIFVSTNGTFFALTSANEIKWSRASSIITSPPVVSADGTVYVTDHADFALHALRGSDGAERWHFTSTTAGSTAAGTVPVTDGAPAILADGTVVTAALDHTVRAIDPGGTLHQLAAGTVRWSSGTIIKSPMEGAVAVSPWDNTIYVGTLSGQIYAFNNAYPLSQYASWPTFQHDPAHTGIGPPPVGGARLVNLSTRAVAGPDVDFIAGLVLAGPTSKRLLLRAVGPTLGQFLPGVMPDPAFTLHVGNAYTIGNDDWGVIDPGRLPESDPGFISGVAAQVGAFPLLEGSHDAAMVTDLAPLTSSVGAYTMTVSAPHNDSGIALLEVYDADAGAAASGTRLINLSTRGHVGTGDAIMIAGLVIGGNGSVPVLIRGVGPGLAAVGVPNVLPRPSITVTDQQQSFSQSNEGWGNTASPRDLQFVSNAVGAFSLPDNSADAAMILSLAPGSYTIKLSGVAGATGNAIIEVYDVSF